jgi:hypothetical protein
MQSRRTKINGAFSGTIDSMINDSSPLVAIMVATKGSQAT